VIKKFGGNPMNKMFRKFSLVYATGVIILAATSKSAMAYEEPVAGFTHDKIDNSLVNLVNNEITTMTLSAINIPMPGFSNIGIADVSTNLLIRSGKGEDCKILGKLPKDGGCDILEADDGSGWTKVSSGKVTGYVKTQYLITGSVASELAKKVGNYVAKANTDGLRVRKSPSVDSDELDKIAKGEELLVLDANITAYGEKYNKWVKVRLDSDDNSVGYVAKEFVDLSYELKKAISMEELDFGSEVSSLRANLINYAKRFLGNPYVYGGNSLSNGIDCSAFTQKIYSKYDIYIPRVSRSQADDGDRIKISQLKPGDLIFYGSGSYISHVAMYIGNDKVIHASNPRDGIKISNMYYRNPIKCVTFIND
jgi:uncharacterized protein YgiM (DUF1202 family)